MHSLGLKVTPGFNPCGGRRRRPAVAGQGGRETDRLLRVAACLPSQPSPSPFDPNSDAGRDGGGSASPAGAFLSRTQKYALLKQQLAVAAKFENYKEAARIRDSLKSFEEEEPALHLRRLMKKAVKEERFEDAARYRDELKVVAPHSLLKCSSDATTLGIRVQVRSVYIEGRSQPLKGQYLFAYRIRITNNSQRPVQLLRRHWIITDANEKTENLWGIGVIGEQPVILPNTGFEYSSACPLTTPSGRMVSAKYKSPTDESKIDIRNIIKFVSSYKNFDANIEGPANTEEQQRLEKVILLGKDSLKEGDFEMKHIDRVGSSTFNVAIAPFSLSIIGDDTDAPL